MAEQQTDIRNPVIFHDTVSFVGTVSIPDGTVDNAAFSSAAADRLATAKQVHRVDLHYDQAPGSDVATATKLLRIARGTGTLLGLEVRPITAPTGGDKAYTVDVQKAANASGSWASMLSAAVTVNSSSVDNTKQSGTVSGTGAVAAGEALRLVVTASGSTGSQGQGLLVTIWYEENPS